jgi:cell division septum initiation protein DivIVA
MSQAAPASAEELDEMRRHNQQLEEQNHELRQRIEELTSDHEDRAATLEINDALEQFKTYLGLKLKDDFADYTAISREALNEVVRRHAHEILGRIFSLLQSEGVRFDRDH